MLLFDSLASLPTQLPAHVAAAADAPGPATTAAGASGGVNNSGGVLPSGHESRTLGTTGVSGYAALQEVKAGLEGSAVMQEAASGGAVTKQAVAEMARDQACSSSSGTGNRGDSCLDQSALEGIAGYLRDQLGLTLLGFDVVLTEGSGEYLVIDVNYFPNFRGGKDTGRWFREAMLDALQKHRSQCNVAC